MGWRERVEIINKAADLITESRSLELAALMAIEVGKNRLEALGDVEESADLIRWNCQANGRSTTASRTPMPRDGRGRRIYDVLRPYGVWAVISPFNFPMALSGGPSSGALVAGNTVVFKPAHRARCSDSSWPRSSATPACPRRIPLRQRPRLGVARRSWHIPMSTA